MFTSVAMSDLCQCIRLEGKNCQWFIASTSKDPHPVCGDCHKQYCQRESPCHVCCNLYDDHWNKFVKVVNDG